MVTQQLLSDPQNRFSKIIQQGIQDVFIPYFSQTQQVYSQFKKCEGTIKDRTCYNWFNLYYGDPRSTFQLNYESGSATIGPGDGTGGIVYVTGRFSFASRALMGAVYYDVKKFSGVCSCLDIVSCDAGDNQFVSFSGDAYVDLTVKFSLDPVTHQLTSLITSNDVKLDKWWTGGVPAGCNQENKLTGFLDNYIFHTMEDALKQKSIQKMLNSSPLFVGPLLIPPSMERGIGPNVTLKFGFNVTEMDWVPGSNIVSVIWGNSTFLNDTDGSQKSFIPTDRDKRLPALPKTCCSPDLLTEVKISLATIEDSVWVVCGALTSSKRIVKIAGVEFFGGIILETPPVITVPENNILQGDISDARILVTCITKTRNITFFDIEIQNLTLFFKPEFNKTSNAWYVSVIGANLLNATFIFHTPAIPSGSVFNEFGQKVFDRFLPDLNSALEYATLPIPSNFVLPLQTVVTSVVRFDGPNNTGYMSIKSLHTNITHEKRSVVANKGKGIYVATAFSNITDHCSLTNIGDSIGIDFIEFDKCTPSIYSGNTIIMAEKNDKIILKTACNRSCLDCWERVVEINVCQNSTVVGDNCFSNFITDGNIYVLHSDKPCNARSRTGEMILGKYGTNSCLNGRKRSFRISSTSAGSKLNLDVCEMLECNVCQTWKDLELGKCIDLDDGTSATVVTNNNKPYCGSSDNCSLIENSLPMILTVFISIATVITIGVLMFKMRRYGGRQMVDNIKGVKGILPVVLNVPVLLLFYISWSVIFFLPSDGVYRNVTINEAAIKILDSWQSAGEIIFAVLVMLALVHLMLVIIFERNLDEGWCYTLLLVPIGLQLILLMFPPLTGKIVFAKIFNVSISANTDPIYASVLRFEAKGLIKIPLSIVTEEIIAILDGMICSILLIPVINGVAIYLPDLLFLEHSVIILWFIVLLLYFYQLSGSGWWILLCYMAKMAINAYAHFNPKKRYMYQIKIGVILVSSVLTWWQISYNGLDAMGHYILTQLATVICMIGILHGLCSLMPLENELNVNGDVLGERKRTSRRPQEDNEELVPLIINDEIYRQPQNENPLFLTTAIHQAKKTYHKIKNSRACKWLKDEEEHAINPNRRMKKRRLYVLIGILFMFGLNLSSVITFVIYQSSPTKMIAALFQSYGIKLSFNVDTPQFDLAFDVFFATSIIGIILNLTALVSFVLAIYIDTGTNRTQKLWKSRLCIFVALIMLIISIILNLFPDYASLIDVKALLPPCGGELEADVRKLFGITLNMFFSIVTLSKLGFILMAIPLSLIHAAEEILHANPTNKLLHSLTILFGLTGPFLIAFPMMIVVQLAYVLSEYKELSPALVPLVCCFVTLPCLLYVVAISIHHRFTHRWRMVWYYAFPICLHFALEFAVVCVLFGFDTVIKGILSLDFVLIFGADCCLVVIILSDALLTLC
jgi:hypothetical protein